MIRSSSVVARILILVGWAKVVAKVNKLLGRVRDTTAPLDIFETKLNKAV